MNIKPIGQNQQNFGWQPKYIGDAEGAKQVMHTFISGLTPTEKGYMASITNIAKRSKADVAIELEAPGQVVLRQADSQHEAIITPGYRNLTGQMLEILEKFFRKLPGSDASAEIPRISSKTRDLKTPRDSKSLQAYADAVISREQDLKPTATSRAQEKTLLDEFDCAKVKFDEVDLCDDF